MSNHNQVVTDSKTAVAAHRILMRMRYKYSTISSRSLSFSFDRYSMCLKKDKEADAKRKQFCGAEGEEFSHEIIYNMRHS